MKKIKLFPALFFLIVITLIYRHWIFSFEIIGGDWPYFANESLRNFMGLFSWEAFRGNGLGGINSAYFIQAYLSLTIFISSTLRIPWVIVYKIFWFGMFIFLSILSMAYLSGKILPQRSKWAAYLACSLYLVNTYILMVTGGGQMGVALSYSVAPLVLASFMDTDKVLKKSLISGLFAGIQIALDPRLAFITLSAVIIYFVIYSVNHLMNKNGNKALLLVFFYKLGIPGIIALLLNAYWILALLIFKQNPVKDLGSAYSSVAALKFFSFATFSNTVGLLHPNWPENIFGKVGFMKAEFIFLPILAYSSLFFIKKQKNILLFASLGLIGTFLAKGANPPFGQIYEWAFTHLAGFIMFRDPTKWYLLIALSYSILIPFSIEQIYLWLSSKLKAQSSSPQFKIKKNLPNVFLIFFISYLLFLIRPAWSGQLGGTFKEHIVPNDYIKLKNLLSSDKAFYRTLWLPRIQRFGFVTNNHPAIEATYLYNATNSAQLARHINDKSAEEKLSDLSIRYVIIPYDSLGEIFIKDRKYNEREYKIFVQVLDNIRWLKKVKGFEKIQVYELAKYTDHFMLSDGGTIDYEMVDPTHYRITFSTYKPASLVFVENYSPYWILKDNDKIIHSTKTQNGLNSFKLEKKGKYNADISYTPQAYYNYGLALSVASFIIIFVSLTMINRKNR